MNQEIIILFHFLLKIVQLNYLVLCFFGGLSDIEDLFEGSAC